MKRTEFAAAGLFLAATSGLYGGDRPPEKPTPEAQARVYITASQSWAVGGWSPWWGLAAGVGGGARPQTAEITKSFAKNCPTVVPTLDRAKADFVLMIEHEGGKSVIRKDTKYAVYHATGDHLASGSTRMVGTAVRKACETIINAWGVSPQFDSPARTQVE